MNPILLHAAKLDARNQKLLFAEALEMEGQVKYEKPYGEKLAFQEGIVVAGALALGILAIVFATPAQAAYRCDEHCQQQTLANAVARGKLLGGDKACRPLTSHYIGDSYGKALGRPPKRSAC